MGGEGRDTASAAGVHGRGWARARPRTGRGDEQVSDVLIVDLDVSERHADREARVNAAVHVNAAVQVAQGVLQPAGIALPTFCPAVIKRFVTLFASQMLSLRATLHR